MGRLKPEFLERVEDFANRVVKVSLTLSSQRRPSRIIDQLIGSGTSVGANAFEADESMSRADFRKCLAITAKELAETRFWLRLIARQAWIDPKRLEPLDQECMELRKIVGTILKRTRPEGR
ncbi:MAG: four helix bundle protein [Planctomycetes bacterium]|nr:four helix bundle protein [Planctomycetota bacterium]